MTVRRVGAAVICAIMSFGSAAFATCYDGVRDGPESDVDCGGDCPACERNDRCTSPRDCYSGRCAEGFCAERSFAKGETLPAGYRVETSDADGAAITRTIGWIALGVGYGSAYVAALSVPGDVSFLYAPVIGPWIEVAQRGQRLPGLIAVDGLFQTVGASLVVYGIAAAGKQLVRDEGVLARVLVVPAAMGRDGYGLSLVGAF
ncbi:MAG TPA: hypothetical protein VH062_33855 [Polyangiaceae bacterium]|jgi:hypothetical protein|nr:hypothetical protein [Polyangiaceae bacterium]